MKKYLDNYFKTKVLMKYYIILFKFLIIFLYFNRLTIKEQDYQFLLFYLLFQKLFLQI